MIASIPAWMLYPIGKSWERCHAPHSNRRNGPDDRNERCLCEGKGRTSDAVTALDRRFGAIPQAPIRHRPPLGPPGARGRTAKVERAVTSSAAGAVRPPARPCPAAAPASVAAGHDRRAGAAMRLLLQRMIISQPVRSLHRCFRMCEDDPAARPEPVRGPRPLAMSRRAGPNLHSW